MGDILSSLHKEIKELNRFISQKSIYECSFLGSVGSEQKGERVGLVMTNDISNTFNPTAWIIPITSKNKKDLPTHHILHKEKYPFLKYEENTVLVEQLCTRDIQFRLGGYLGKIDDRDFNIIVEKIVNNLKVY